MIHGIAFQVTNHSLVYLRIDNGDMFGHSDIDQTARVFTIEAAVKCELLMLTIEDV